ATDRTTNILRTTNGYSYAGMECISLPPRESQVLLLSAAGKSQPECAAILHCGVGNIKDRRRNLSYKLREDNITQLVTNAMKSGVLRFLVLMLALHVSTTGQFLTSSEEFIARNQPSRTRSRTRVNGTRLRRDPATGAISFV